MKQLATLLLCIISIQSYGQAPEKLVGLWLVGNVNIGDEVMTPNAKWTRLNEDYTQESGNGWFQHSVGSWEFDEVSNQLKIITENGLDDPFGGFSISWHEEQMIWKRMEEGMEVVVTLEKIDELPLTYANQMLGLWKPEQATGEGPFFREDLNESDYLFIRWDGKFVVGTDEGKTYGVYNVYAHKPEVELIPYGGMDRTFWSIYFLDDGVKITLLNSEEKVTRTFQRIKKFPK